LLYHPKQKPGGGPQTDKHLPPSPFTVPEFIDPVFAKTSPRRAFSVIENARFWLVFATTGSINSGTGQFLRKADIYDWSLLVILVHGGKIRTGDNIKII
jgi:hypothetical protein